MPGKGVISEAVARQIVALLEAQQDEVRTYYESIFTDVSDQERPFVARLIGTIMGEIFAEGIRPLMLAHPDLQTGRWKDVFSGGKP